MLNQRKHSPPDIEPQPNNRFTTSQAMNKPNRAGKSVGSVLSASQDMGDWSVDDAKLRFLMSRDMI